jgi:hypothetical protein
VADLSEFYKVKVSSKTNPDLGGGREFQRAGLNCYKGGSADKSAGLDRRVMEKLEIKPGDRFKASDLFALIKEKISPSDIRDLCRGCEWLSLEFCPRGLEKLSTLDMFADRKH